MIGRTTRTQNIPDVGSTELCTPSEELLMALDEAGVFELPWLGVEVP